METKHTSVSAKTVFVLITITKMENQLIFKIVDLCWSTHDHATIFVTACNGYQGCTEIDQHYYKTNICPQFPTPGNECS